MSALPVDSPLPLLKGFVVRGRDGGHLLSKKGMPLAMVLTGQDLCLLVVSHLEYHPVGLFADTPLLGCSDAGPGLLWAGLAVFLQLQPASEWSLSSAFSLQFWYPGGQPQKQ